MGYAAAAAVSGEVVRVARGTYAESGIVIGSGVTVEGGWDADFGSWQPDPWLTLLDGGGAAELVSLDGELQGLTLTNADTCVQVGYLTPGTTKVVERTFIAGCATAGIALDAHYMSSTHLAVANSVVVANGRGITVSASGGGSEFFCFVYLDVVSSTVSLNGTGIELLAAGGFSGQSHGSIISSVVWGNSDENVSLAPSPGSGGEVTVTESYSDIGSVGFSPYCNVVPFSWCSLTGAILNLDPLLAADNYHLLPGSPCVDTGSPAQSPPVDFEGDARPFDGDGDGAALPDMGADEMTDRIFSDGFEVGDTFLWTEVVPSP